MNIESAIDQFLSVPALEKEDELKEFHVAVGEMAATKMGFTYPVSDEVKTAYLLGLQTARVVVRDSAILLMKGFTPTELAEVL